MILHKDLYEKKISDIKDRRAGRLTAVLIALCILVFFTEFIWLGCVQVEGSSMDDTVHDGDYLILDKLRSPKRGDVIVFTHTAERYAKSYIKRVVAEGGDVIRIENDRLYIKAKGQKGFEMSPYNRGFARIRGKTEPTGSEWATAHIKDGVPYEIPSGCVFVMGDNRERSRDSRSFGPIPHREIDGVITEFVIERKDTALGLAYQKFCGLRTKFGNFLKKILGIEDCARQS